MTRLGRAAGWALALAVAACTGPTTAGSGVPTGTEPAATAGTTASVSEAPASPTPDAREVARHLLTDVDGAGRASPGELRRAVATSLRADLAGLVDDTWRERAGDGLSRWPVHVGEATIGLDGSVELDMVLVTPPDEDGELVLRWLAAAPALGDAVQDLSVTVAGTTAEVAVDAAGARLTVPVRAGQDAVVRVKATYRVPDRAALDDDGTPAGYGLLARTDDAVLLGHWLPLVALPSDDGPMLARGDVGAFPPAVFSVVVRHEGTLVSGGEERPCPEPAPDCTWLQGVGLRDLSAVAYAHATTSTATTSSGTTAAVHLPGGTAGPDATARVAEESARTLEAFTAALGTLPWPSLDVVAAPIGPGTAGMEFPGMVWIDTGAWPQPGPDFGSYVLVHEVAHQWFHALVGNGSLSAPVVDESLAQYLSVVAFDAVFGDGAGQALAGRSLGGRHARALADGLPDETPAQPLDAFSSARSYGANVYGRGGQAWVDAEAVAGREAVLDALRVLVARFGLREVDEATVLEVVGEVAPEAAPVVAAGWGLDGA